jgi:preprotein translocase subunit SecG
MRKIRIRFFKHFRRHSRQLFFDNKDKAFAIFALKKTLIITCAFFVLAILLYFSFDYAAPADVNLKSYFTHLTQGNTTEANSIYKQAGIKYAEYQVHYC